MSQITDELLPCPFCGGEAELVVEHDHSWVRHNECGLYFEGGFVDPDDAVAAWNRRTAQPVAWPTKADVQTFMDSMFGEYSYPTNCQTWVPTAWDETREKVRVALETLSTPPVGAETGEDNSDA